jgi:predicted kinase
LLFDELFILLPIDLQLDLVCTLQNRTFHAEGSVYSHIKLVSNVLPENDINLQMCALFHDLGKIDTFSVNEKENKIAIQSIGHENYCKHYIEKYKHLYKDYDINWELVLEVCYYHMRMHKYLSGDISRPNKRKAMEELKYFEGLRQFAIADAEGRILGEGKPYVIVTVSPPGGGKSTWANAFAIKANYSIINPDNIRKELTGDISDQSKNNEVWNTAYHRLKELLIQKKDVIFDSCACNVRTIKSLKTVVKEKDAVIMFKLFDTPIEICKQRIKEDIEKGVDRSKVPDEIVDKMFNGFEEVKNYLIENKDLIITVKE